MQKHIDAKPDPRTQPQRRRLELATIGVTLATDRLTALDKVALFSAALNLACDQLKEEEQRGRARISKSEPDLKAYTRVVRKASAPDRPWVLIR